MKKKERTRGGFKRYPHDTRVRDGFSFSRAVQNVRSELMNRNPPIMRLRLHWLRYDLTARATPTATPLLLSRLVPSPQSPPRAAHVHRRAHTHTHARRVNVAHDTLRRGAPTPVLLFTCARQGPSQRDCRRETNYFPEERARARCRSPTPLTRQFFSYDGAEFMNTCAERTRYILYVYTAI